MDYVLSGSKPVISNVSIHWTQPISAQAIQTSKYILTLNISHCAYVVFGSEYKFIVQNPLRFVIKAGRWMKLYNLVILDRHVVASTLQMCHLK